MHKLTNSINNKGNKWSRKCEILKSTYNLMKACSIRKQRIRQYDSFTCRDRSINKFARCYTSPSEDVKCIFMLSLYKTHTSRLNLSTKK